MESKRNTYKYHLQYSGLFLFLFSLIYCVYFIEKKSFVYALYGDGHICFNSLVYYGEWLRAILRTGNIPSFDLTVGYGSDLFLTLSWETLGDPLNLLAVFFDADHMEYLYDFLAVFRIYLAGIAFSIFARCHYCSSRGEEKSNLTILAGSMIYVFSGFVLFAGVRDVYFMTPVIFFPLMASGIDRILQERKPVMLIVTTALAAISNYYYFYMLTVFTVLYALLAYAAEQDFLQCRGKRNGKGSETGQDGTERRSNLRKNSKRFLQAFLSCAGAYLIGTLIACVQLVPIAIYLMESSRSQQQYYVPLLYSLEFYARVFSGYISSASNTAWTHLGFAPIMLPAVAVLFLNRKKTYRPYRIAFAACVLFLCIPRIGSILNGMTYPVNRWIWAFSMLNACIFILVEDDLFHLNRRRLIFVLAACFLYSAVCLSVPQLRTRQEKCMILILLLTAAVILLVNTRGKRVPSPARSDLSAGGGREINRENPAGKKAAAYLTGYQCVGLVLVIIGVTANGLFRFAPFGSNYAAGFVDAGQAWPLVNDNLATDLVQDREDLAAVRVDALGDTLPMCNTGMNHGINGTDFYFSLANGSVTQFMDDLGVNVEMEHRYAGLDGRTILERLFGVKYVVTNENNAAFVPYGYQEETADEETSGDGKDTCYTDPDTLPLGYGYDSIIRESDFAKLDAVKKQEAILHSAVVSDEDYEMLSGSLREGEPVYNDQETSFAVVSTADGIAIHDSEITVSEENAQITLRVQAVQDAETYLVLASPEYDLGSPEEQGMALIDFSVDGSTKQMKLYSVTHPYNHGRKEYIINLGYNDSDTVRTVTVTFHNTGIYRASSIRAVCQPMTLIGDQTAARRETVLQDISLGDDMITGTVDAKKDTLLCVSVPYSSGWTATIDGKKAEVVRTQDMFLGVAVPAGEHEIRLLYETPGQKEGMALSISGLLLLAGILVCQNRRKKRTLQKKQEIKAVWGDHEKTKPQDSTSNMKKRGDCSASRRAVSTGDFITGVPADSETGRGTDPVPHDNGGENMIIPVVFCFDENLVRQVRVAAASLLETRGSVHYHIYCVCTEKAMQTEPELRAVFARRDPGSELTMMKAPGFFSNSYQRGSVTAGTYLRLMLGSILPELDRVIYCDIDVLFRDSLLALWQTDLDGMLLAAVRGAVNFCGKWKENERRSYWHFLEPVRGNYINAGVLLMNLKEIRAEGMEKIWKKYSGEKFYYQDQDILNLTCGGKIVFLEPRWNLQAYMDREEYSQYVECGAYRQEEVDEALENPAILHFTADKPWNRYDIHGNAQWWTFVDANEDLRDLFDEEAAKRNHGPGIVARGIRKIRRILGLEI